MWEEFTHEICETIGEALEIIDDALCFGYEFKVENHKLWFRQICDAEENLSTELSTKS